MDPNKTSNSRRSFLAATATLATGAAGLVAAGQANALHLVSDRASGGGGGDKTIRPYRIAVPEAVLADLKERIARTRWPEKETVADRSQGAQLDKIRALVDRWVNGYDWRKSEARLNALPQFITTIDGLGIQFIHVRSKHKDALPLIMTHGWPGSPFELLKVIEPLTNPTAHGGTANDAFHLVIPTYPGYGFSEKPTDPSWGPDHVARAWHQLMLRLGYSRYVSQGGDWGAIISEVLAVQAPEGLLGIHINMPGTMPPEVLKMVRNFEPVPDGFSAEEKRAYAGLLRFYKSGFGYADIMNTRPQTIGYALADSPVAMAAYYYDKIADWTDSGGEPERVVTVDEMLDNITLYWVTNSGTSTSRSYWDAAQGGGGPFNAFDIAKIPVAVSVFPGEIYQAPRSWGEKCFRNLIYWNEAPKGGHFAAWEQPDIFSRELRAAFRSLRG